MVKLKLIELPKDKSEMSTKDLMRAADALEVIMKTLDHLRKDDPDSLRFFHEYVDARTCSFHYEGQV